jgi:hypothetical protein
LEGGALSPPECRSRHSSNKLKPALTEQRFDKARNKARDKDCSTKSYTLHRHGQPALIKQGISNTFG